MARTELQMGRGQWNYEERLLPSILATLLWPHRLHLDKKLLTFQSGLSTDKQGPEAEEDRIP